MRMIGLLLLCTVALFAEVFTCVGCEREVSPWVIPASGGSPARVTPPGGPFGLGSTWSPDGQWMALNEGFNVVLLQIGSAPQPVMVRQNCVWPTWSPTADVIACMGQPALELISKDGKLLRTFDATYGDSVITNRAWSRDGRSLFLTREEAGRRVLHRLDADTGRLTLIRELPPGFQAQSPMAGARLSLSADGNTLATSVDGGDSDIWILDGFEALRTFWERLWPLKR